MTKYIVCLDYEETMECRTSVFERNPPVEHDDEMHQPGEEEEVGYIVEEVETTEQDSGDVESSGSSVMVSDNFFLPVFGGIVVREENLVKLFNLACYLWFIWLNVLINPLTPVSAKCPGKGREKMSLFVNRLPEMDGFKQGLIEFEGLGSTGHGFIFP